MAKPKPGDDNFVGVYVERNASGELIGVANFPIDRVPDEIMAADDPEVVAFRKRFSEIGNEILRKQQRIAGRDPLVKVLAEKFRDDPEVAALLADEPPP